MRRAETKLVVASLILFLLILFNYGISFGKSNEGKGETLTSCLRAKDVKVYGRADCGYCRKQKQMFSFIGEDLDGIYVECMGSRKCRSQRIKAFPTWVIEGHHYRGVQELSVLKRVSGC